MLHKFLPLFTEYIFKWWWHKPTGRKEVNNAHTVICLSIWHYPGAWCVNAFTCQKISIQMLLRTVFVFLFVGVIFFFSHPAISSHCHQIKWISIHFNLSYLSALFCMPFFTFLTTHYTFLFINDKVCNNYIQQNLVWWKRRIFNFSYFGL